MRLRAYMVTRSLVVIGLAFVPAGCLVDGSPDPAALYEGCRGTGDCLRQADACFVVDWLDGRGGMCSMYCDDHDDCPGFASCWELVGDPIGNRICYARCATDSDCPVGFDCVDAQIVDEAVDAVCLPAG